jgi:YVTN family beta-propeller protein
MLGFFALMMANAEPAIESSQSAGEWAAPVAIQSAADGGRVFVAAARSRCLDECDLGSGKVRPLCHLPAVPSGVALTRELDRLFVTCGDADGSICEVSLPAGRARTIIRTGHTPMSPLVSRDGKRLYFCLRFNNQVVVIDTATRKEIRRISVGREPVSLDETLDGRFLFVAHHLPSGRADVGLVAATIGVVDLEAGSMTQELSLPNGSSLVREVRLSPDGRYAAVTHNLARFQVPTTQLERGWMNTSALSVLDVSHQAIIGTVLLDEVDRGLANPWAVVWNKSGERLFITHAGTHELSVIDFPGLLAKVTTWRGKKAESTVDPADDLAFILGFRQRVKLAGNGPRSMALAGHVLAVGNYFSDSIDTLDLSDATLTPRPIQLRPASAPSELRLGEQYFNDATICFQGWQSCASCHSSDARVDGLNWDLLNDGIGNPKNSKSLLYAHRTPPAMSMGVRYTAEAAVRAGLQHILFAVPAEAIARPMDGWLQSLEPAQSPYLVKRQLSKAAASGKLLFNSARTRCASCHTPGLFTDLRSYDVGTTTGSPDAARPLDTPTLIELWRTGPYLHDGSAATIRDVLTTRNPADRHGATTKLSERELTDLVEYLLSL